MESNENYFPKSVLLIIIYNFQITSFSPIKDNIHLLYTCLVLQNHLMLQDETLHLAVTLTDQFLMRRPVNLAKLQLVGVTCLLIAAKFVERFTPDVSLFLL